jgi:hypothetical protein
MGRLDTNAHHVATSNATHGVVCPCRSAVCVGAMTAMTAKAPRHRAATGPTASGTKYLPTTHAVAQIAPTENHQNARFAAG